MLNAIGQSLYEAFSMFWETLWALRFGGGTGYAKDPVCGMQVETATSPATVVHDTRRYFFCSDHCNSRFTAGPESSPSAAAGPRSRACLPPLNLETFSAGESLDEPADDLLHPG